MAELVQKIQELTSLDDDIHWFCPRDGPEDGSLFFEEDVLDVLPGETAEEKAARGKKIEEARERTSKVLDACTILAFDGGEAQPYQDQLKLSLRTHLTRCDICIREFHRSRGQLKTSLESQYAADEVEQFMRRFDEMNQKRIGDGLNSATDMLLDQEPDKRNIQAAGDVGMYALFEALNCLPFLDNDDALKKFFDRPFKLVQTKKKIKLPSYAPGMATFLFSSNQDRATWAVKNFTGIKRPLTGTEFDYGVKPALEQALGRVPISFLDEKFVPDFWRGTRIILSKLTRELVTNHLRAMDNNLYTTALEHFQIRNRHFDDLTASFKMLLELNPNDFWEALGACTPQQLLEQVFKAPQLEEIMSNTQETEPLLLDAKLSFLRPLISSIRPANLIPPMRALLDQLFKRCQEEKYSQYARNVTWTLGLQCLNEALNTMPARIKGGPVLTDMIQLVANDYLHLIMPELDDIQNKDEMRISKDQGLCLMAIRQLLRIDVQNLGYDHGLVAINKSLDHELSISGLRPWKMSMNAVKPGHPYLAIAVAGGIEGLMTMEPFTTRQIQAAPRQAKDWNSALSRVIEATTEFLERMEAFTPDQLAEMYSEQEGASAIMSLLFSGDERINNAALNLLKTLSGEDGRRESLMHVVEIFMEKTLQGAVSAIRAIGKARTCRPSMRLVRLCMDMWACLCDSSDGILRSAKALNSQEVKALESFWQSTWLALNMIFEQTEPWSNLGHDKQTMQDFCQETMEFADYAFDQYSIVAHTITAAAKSDSGSVGKQLLEFPTSAFGIITKWLRLRDDLLIKYAVSLTTKMLSRLQEVGIEVSENAQTSIEHVLTGKTRTKLTMNQKAEIQRALEKHTGTELSKTIDIGASSSLKQSSLQGWAGSGSRDSSRSATPNEVGKPKKPGAIDVDAWSKAAVKSRQGSETSQAIKSASSTADLWKKRQELQGKKAMGPATVRAAQNQRDPKTQADFLTKRKKEKEEQERKRAEALAKAKGVSVGSGVSGLGDMGKDHTLKGQNVMVSSDEESESDDDLDDELFGGKVKDVKKSRGLPDVNPNGAVGLKPEQKKGPTRIQRTQRSVKDMRARLAPDLGSLHRVILKWDFFHEGDYPPGSNEHAFRQVSNSFTDPTTYQETFQPLLLLEAWQGMVKSREEDSSKPYDIKVVNRSNVDQFIEINSSVTHVENRELKLQEGDIILLSTASKPTDAPEAPNCLARIYRVKRQKAHNEIVYQLVGGSLGPHLTPGKLVHGVKIQSITPLEREYGALQGLQYYDLCNQIVKAKPSPRFNFSEKQIAQFQDVWNVNRAQSEAINAALDNEGFSLIQGPPGSGKTKTIVAIVGGLLSNVLGSSTGGTKISVPGQRLGLNGNLEGGSKKLLVCAPSNAAVDELVMRLKEGVKTKHGKHHPLNVVRIGRSDAINTQVVDVTMDELVAKHLGGSNDDQKMRQKNAELYKEHEKVSAELRELYGKRDDGKIQGPERTELDNNIVAVRKRKNELGIRIDNSKDQERQAGREAELNRKRAQQAVLDNAHVICATLSGSGHDMFQSLNIEFETVIIDEAAQCVEMSSLIPLKYGCIKCIMVGDPKQLPPTVFSKEAARFQYEQSLFVRMQNNFADEVHLLDTQYRMHPDISIFPSRTFYDGLLKDGDGMAALRQRPWHASSLLAPYRFFDVKGQHQAAPKGHSLINIAEIDVAMALYTRVRTDFGSYDYTGRIGIITPYKSQLKALKDRFSSRFGNDIFDTVEFNTTDAFQGRESEIIIFSCVRASPAGGIGFLQDIRRMNVGLTRAKASLWVLGNSESLVRGQYWRKLVEDAQARDSYTTGDLMGMLKKPSSAFPASETRTVSMLDINTHQHQMQPTNRTPSAPPRQPSAPQKGASNGGDRPSSATPDAKQEANGSRMEGVSTRFEDYRAKSKKRPAEVGDDAAVRPRLSSNHPSEDVEMADATEDSGAPMGLDGTVFRDETPLSNGDEADHGEEGGTKKMHVAQSVPQPPIRRKKKPVDPFLSRR